MKEKWICEVPSGGIKRGKVDEANAALISAAPDLLTALEALGNWLAYGLAKPDGEKPTADDLKRAEELGAQAAAAVRKAKGA